MSYIKAETEIPQTVYAANPWDNHHPTQFSICVHYKGGFVPSYAINDKRPRIQCYYIYSATDNRYRPMPDVFAKLWRDGKLPGSQIPELLNRIEPQVGKNDLIPYLILTPSQRSVKTAGIILLGIIISVLGWLLYKEGLEWALALTIAGFVFITSNIVRLHRMKSRRKKLRDWLLREISTNAPVPRM